MALKQAVEAANNNNHDDLINLAPKCVYVLELPLSPTLTIAPDNQHSITIHGNGATISGGNQMRIFHIQPGATITLEQLNIRDGRPSGEERLGGGIFNDQGTITIRISILADNLAKNGGAIFNDKGTVTVEKSLFSHNEIEVNQNNANTESASVIKSDSLEDNLAANGGGAIFNKLGTVNISNSTMADNQAANGAAIFNYGGTLSNTFTTFSGNFATYNGGSIYNSGGFVFLTDTTLTNNSAGRSSGVVSNWHGQINIKGSILARNTSPVGGVIGNFEDGTLTIADSNFYNNSAEFGGTIDNEGRTEISNTTFSDNVAMFGSIIESNNKLIISGSTLSNNIMSNSYGGGSIGNTGSARIINSTFSGNSAVNGSAIYNQGREMDIIHSTFADNITNEKYGAAVYNAGGGYEMTISYSILANTLYGKNCQDMTIGGYGIKQPAPNWISDGSCDPAFSGDPLLGPLKLYAPGMTMTYALLNGSGAIDVVPCDPDIHYDQRGVVRPQGINCDLGAYEYTVILSPSS